MAQLVVGGRVTGEELLILGKIHEMPDCGNVAPTISLRPTYLLGTMAPCRRPDHPERPDLVLRSDLARPQQPGVRLSAPSS